MIMEGQEVISIPKIMLDVKLRYSTDDCEDYTRSHFIKGLTGLLNRQICYNSKCQLTKVDASCQHKEKGRNLEFLAKIVIMIYIPPTANCGISCTSESMKREITEVQQSVQHDILKKGIITIPSGTFDYSPKAITHLSKKIYCGPDFVPSSYDYFCEPCKPGTFFADNKCNPCAMDSYNPHFGSRQCYACPQGKETYSKESTSEEQCINRNDSISAFAIAFLICGLVIKVLILLTIKLISFDKDN